MERIGTYEALLTRIRSLIATTDHIPVVGISGHGGSGKSTLSERLGFDLGVTPDQVVPTDCFYATSCGPDAGIWEQHDWSMLEALVQDVRSVPPPDRLSYEYRWWTGENGFEEQPMPPVVIMEGIRLFHERTRGWFDLTVWIDMDPQAAGTRRKRATSRKATHRPNSTLGTRSGSRSAVNTSRR
jgi:uridine kinase